MFDRDHRISTCSFRGRFLASTCLSAVLLVLLADAAAAQPGPEAPPPPPSADPVTPPVAAVSPQRPVNPAEVNAGESIVVTGSRIRSAVSAETNPVTVVGPAVIERQRSVTLEDIVRKQPELDANGGGTTANLNQNGSYQQTNVGLRNLGPNRTLILLDGKRALNTNGSTSVDLDTIPVALIDRIEILKSGASSIYGADAIGGVINIITKKNFDGLRLDASAGIAERSDAQTLTLSALGGVNFGRGNLVVNFGYARRDPAYQRYRAWARDQFLDDPDLVGQGPRAAMPGFNATGTGVEAGRASLGTPLGYRAYFYGPLNQYVITRTSPTTPFIDALKNAGLSPLPGVFFINDQNGYGFDLSSTQILTSGEQIKNFGANLRYEVADNVRVVLNGSYVDKSSTAQLSPFSQFNVGDKFPGLYIPQFLEDYQWDRARGTLVRTVLRDARGNPIDNPGNPFDFTISGSTRLPIPSRFFTFDAETLRVQGGLEGTIAGRYDWEIGGSYSQAHLVSDEHNQVNLFKLAQVTGQRPCGQDAASGCSVGDFLGVGGLTPAQINYFTFDAVVRTRMQQKYAYANITGPIARLPGGDLAFALGAETRREEFAYRTAREFRDGEAFRKEGDTNGHYSVDSVYLEINAPLLRDVPFAHSLSLNASGRYDRYSNFGSAKTWKAEAEYSPISSIRFRGTYSTSFRAPNIAELYSGSVGDTQRANDPCRAVGGRATTNTRCLAELNALGVNPTLFEVTSGVQPVTFSGNPNLQPERARSWTLGAVLTPSFLPNLSASADYYKIKLRNAVTQFNAGSIIGACYDSGAQCGLITRAPGSGFIQNIAINPVNAGSESVEGVDFALSYEHGTNFLIRNSHFDAHLIVAWLISHKQVDADGNVVERAGYFDAGSSDSQPHWKASADLGWTIDNFRLGWNTRFIGPSSDLNGSPKGTRGYYAPTYWVHDLSLQWRPANYVFTIGVDNLFDKDPPVIIDGQTNSLPSSGYDYIGRFFFVKAGVKF